MTAALALVVALLLALAGPGGAVLVRVSLANSPPLFVSSVAGAMVAAQHAREDGVLGAAELRVELELDNLTEGRRLRAALAAAQNASVDAYISTSQTDTALWIGRAVRGHGLPVWYVNSASSVLEDADEYPAALRLLASTRDTALATAALVRHAGWRAVSLLVPDGSFSNEFRSHFVPRLAEYGVRVDTTAAFAVNDADSIADALAEVAAATTRVVVAIITPLMTEGVLLGARDAGMVSPTYQWLAPLTTSEALWETGADRAALNEAAQGWMGPRVANEPLEAVRARVDADYAALVDAEEWAASVRGMSPFPNAYRAYNAMYATAGAAGTGAAGRAALREAVLGLPAFDGPIGPFSVGASGKADVVITAAQVEGESIVRRALILENGTVRQETAFVPPPPESYAVDTCGPSARRVDLDCEPCPDHEWNDPDDGVEACEPCGPGETMASGRCRPCPDGRDSVVVEGTTERVCVASGGGSDHAGAEIAGVVLGSVVLGALVASAIARWVHWSRTLQREADTARRSAEREKNFVTFVFHELRNPLNGVVSYLHFILSDLEGGRSGSGGGSGGGGGGGGGGSDDGSGGGGDDDDAAAAVAVAHDWQRTRDAAVSNTQNAIVSCDHACEVLDNVLAMMKLADGKLVLAPTPTNLGTLLEQVVLITRPRSAGAAVEHSVDVSERLGWPKNRPPALMLDQRLLRQVLVNLAANAVKHTDDGLVRVSVSVRPCPAGVAAAAAAEAASGAGAGAPLRERVSLLVSVTDTGEGVPPEMAQKLFRKWASFDTRAGSSGLGLALSQSIVTFMGSIIQLESPWRADGPGSRFYFEIVADVVPAPPSPRPEDEVRVVDLDCGDGSGGAEEEERVPVMVTPDILAPPSQVGGAGARLPNPMRVLVADDLRLNRSILRRKLTRSACESVDVHVEEVETGEQAIARLKAGERYHLVVLDEIMSSAGGELRGSEAAVIIRGMLEGEDSGRWRTLLVSCSGNCTDDDVARYLASGMDLSWGKPLPHSDKMFEQLAGAWTR